MTAATARTHARLITKPPLLSFFSWPAMMEVPCGLPDDIWLMIIRIFIGREDSVGLMCMFFTCRYLRACILSSRLAMALCTPLRRLSQHAWQQKVVEEPPHTWVMNARAVIEPGSALRNKNYVKITTPFSSSTLIKIMSLVFHLIFF